MLKSDRDVEYFQVEKLKVEVHSSREAAGAAAAKASAEALKKLAARGKNFGVIFATGASQMEALKSLTAMPGLPWSQVDGFHMDDYIGLPLDHPASFRGYLDEKLVRKVPMHSFAHIDGLAPNPEQTCRDYAERLRVATPQLCLLGIGENGHLAFNDPPADFEAKGSYIVVKLDDACRRQQLGEGWFPTFEDVPKQSISMTIPQILEAKEILAIVPDTRKAAAVKACLEGPISPLAPASVLQNHPDATIYLDEPSAAQLSPATKVVRS